MSFKVTKTIDREANRLVKNYPEKRSASLMVLHAIQEEFGYISKEAEVWAAEKLGLKPCKGQRMANSVWNLPSASPVAARGL